MFKLAVSNIAWSIAEEPEIAQLLQKMGIQYVEIAPTKVWADPLHVSDEQLHAYSDFWAQYGITVIAFQSMLFGKPELTIFDDESIRQQTGTYLKAFIELAGRIGAEALVFGSPKNRQVKDLGQAEAYSIAQTFFSDLGMSAAQHSTHFCLEPNGEAYSCDFITTAAQGLELVSRINTPGFDLHLDTGCMTMSKDGIYNSITAAGSWLRHFHVSAPFLDPIEEQLVDHRAAAEALKAIQYPHIVSIEMRSGDEGTNVQRVQDAILLTKKYYC